jgi:hypothetical protein
MPAAIASGGVATNFRSDGVRRNCRAAHAERGLPDLGQGDHNPRQLGARGFAIGTQQAVAANFAKEGMVFK